MEPEDSLPCTEDTATFPYPEPEQSNLRPPIMFKIHVNIILPSTPRTTKQPLSFRFLHQNSVLNSLLHYTCHTSRPPTE
jgi:hypothetical protein